MTPTNSRAYGARTYGLSCRVADQHLTLAGGMFKHRHPRSRRSQDNQLAVHSWITAEDQVDRTRFDSSGSVQHDLADGSLGASHLGKSALQACDAVEAEGGTVLGVIALVDREGGGREAIEALGYAVHTIFPVTELLEATG